MDRIDSAYNNDEYYLRYDPDEVDIVEEKKESTSWPLLMLVPLIAIVGISTYTAYQQSNASNSIQTGDTNTLFGVGGAPEIISPLPETHNSGHDGLTGPAGPSGAFEYVTPSPVSSLLNGQIPRRSRYIP